MMEEALAAGRFTEWLAAHRAASKSSAGADVPCGSCVGCCTSSYFIPIAPDETRALARIPKALLFPAPGRKGYKVMGYDDKGHCPMFRDGKCSIYADRPRTCRTYDCRVFPATGLPVDEGKPAIAERVARWRFDFADDEDRRLLAAARAAARFLREHANLFPEGFVPSNPTQQAVLALEVHSLFLDPATASHAPETCARAVVEATRRSV